MKDKRAIALALRRYLIEQFPSREYWAWFGCSAEFMRDFFAAQFGDRYDWVGYPEKWRIGHLLALDSFVKDEEWLAWNWGNLVLLDVTEARSRVSLDRALRILSDRCKIFPENHVLGQLIVRAYALREQKQHIDVKKMMDLRNRYVQEHWNVSDAAK